MVKFIQDRCRHLKEKHFYAVLKLTIFLLVLSLCLYLINNVVKRKENYIYNKDFFSQKEEFDVLFFGNSHMKDGIFPMELYRDYGIVSYNLAQDSLTPVESYYNMLLALKEKKPKLIVIDAYRILLETKSSKEDTGEIKAILHKAYDSYPMSFIKHEAIKDILGEEKLLENEIEFVFNFALYHSRWSELTKEDFDLERNYQNGAYSRIKVREPKTVSNFIDVDEYKSDETINMQYMRKIIQYSKENDIEILMIYLPYFAEDKDIGVSKYCKKICNDHNINYLNFLEMDNLVNYKTDMADIAHLNPSGSRKITNYLGKYIMENYDIPDQRKNEAYNFWNEDYDEYIDFKINNLAKHSKELNNYLMLLYDEKDIKYEIKISSKNKIEKDSVFKALLENLNNNYEVDDEVFKENKDKTVKITTWDNRTGELIKEVWF